MNETSPRQQEGIEDALARVAARAAAGPVVNDAASRQRVLERRARALAKPLAVHDAAMVEDEMDILVFLVNDERLGIPLASIVAIIRRSGVTPLPRAVAPVYGVTAWRGRPLTVLSVGKAVAPTADMQNRLIVLGDGRRAVVGLLADAVDDTLVVRRSLLSPARSGARGLFAMGVTEDAVLVLDADAMLNAARPES